ncbi:copper homeostasis protein cutC homolog [Thrips palmi]|uniref:Copper homeostasis protein cutC homolog n=1 Tax=Thrips palmi TaxID=161013 RepID=A0A6P9AE35_THRPL|nr:copper homeostasis protein cutC homolog [Thrips palmi]
MEVCVDSIQSAINAEKGGASRLELCSALSEGGLTPTPGLLKAVKEAVSIPVFCMLRARGGNDFVYSAAEIEVMKTDALLLRAVGGADGFVFGALTPQGGIDIKACQDILQVTAPLPVTFHRAIDVCHDPLGAMHIIAELGFKRILTSGQQDSAERGIELIKNMVSKGRDQISIMIGAGVNKNNVAHILKETGAKEYHGSARIFLSDAVASNRPKMGPGDSAAIAVTDAELVSQIVKEAKCVLQD